MSSLTLYYSTALNLVCSIPSHQSIKIDSNRLFETSILRRTGSGLLTTLTNADQDTDFSPLKILTERNSLIFNL